MATRFTLSQDSKGWAFVSPEGERFFSMGVCCTNRGIPTADWDATNPGYAASRIFKSDQEWACDTVAKLESWGFNTVGSWSDHKLLRSDLYQTPVLHLGAAGIPWRDMWDPKVVEDTFKRAEQEIGLWHGDPRIVGYFSDNELGWWHSAMFEWAFTGATPASGTRKRLVDLLRKRYATWEEAMRDFEPKEATSFEELEKQGRLFLKPGGKGILYAKDVLRMQAKRYYELCREAIERYDPKALYLGDRYISDYYPEVAEEAGKVCDVVSTNLNANWPDGDFYRYYLEELHRISGKPLIVTEFYQCAMENRSGNMNDRSAFPTVRTQKERVKGLRNQLRLMLSKPFLVGAHWFQYYDEPMHGRTDGENFNMGLVDTAGRPYDDLVKAFRDHRRPRLKAANAGDGLPPVDAFTAGDLANWPRERAYVPHEPGDYARGDLYVGWHPQGLIVGISWKDGLWPEGFFKSGQVPPEERAKLTMKFQGMKEPVSATMGYGGELEAAGANAISHRPNTPCHAVFRIPSNRFGKAQLKAGDRVEFEASMTTQCRSYHMAWKGSFELKEK
ncbi:MAG TPA: hypothetical protein VGE01_13215 [Fimbriimonas sp.]